MPNRLILINPHAAGGRARSMASLIQSWAAHAGAAGAAIPTEMPETVAQALQVLGALPPETRVVVVGGDGTLNQLLPGLLQGHHSVGLLPFGSGNDNARAWGLTHMKWQEALHYALDSKPYPIDVGSVTFGAQKHSYFLSSLALGFDASVGNRALGGPSFLRGLPRYLYATFGELANLKNWDLKISVNGQQVHQGPCLLASSLNTRTYASGMPIAPAARINDGYLNLLVAGQFNRLQTLAMLTLMLMGKHLGRARIHTWTFENLRIESNAPFPLAADGETLGVTQLANIHILPARLQVVRPAFLAEK